MIVVFGGAFNPPTIAHKEIYHLITQQLNVTKFIFLPVSKKYSKANLIDDQHRVQMLEIMCEHLDKAVVSVMETEDEQFLGTYKSLLRIKGYFPKQTIAFVLGADNLEHLHHWKNAEKLLNEFQFIVIKRHQKNMHQMIDNHQLLRKYKDHFTFLDHFESNVSSTLFRETLDPYYVDEDVYHYIMKNELY